MSRDGMIAILTYHSLDERESVLSIPPRAFAQQMQILRSLGVRVIPLDEVRDALSANTVVENMVVLTFDDGFQSVHEYGLPILQRYSFPATIFLVTDYCGKTNSWPGEPPHIGRRPLLRWAEIEEMSACGVTFGSHTRTHPDLTTIPKCDVEEELVGSKKRIEDAIGRPVDTLAYPYGACDDAVKQLAQAHFSLGCSTTLGFVRTRSNPYALERLDMCYMSSSVLFRRLFSAEVGAYVGLRKYLRGVRRRVLR